MDTRTSDTVSVAIDGEEEASYRIDTSPGLGEMADEDMTLPDPDDLVFFNGWETFEDTDRVREVFRTGSRFVRIVLTDGTAVADKTATVSLSASGG